MFHYKDLLIRNFFHSYLVMFLIILQNTNVYLRIRLDNCSKVSFAVEDKLNSVVLLGIIMFLSYHFILLFQV